MIRPPGDGGTGSGMTFETIWWFIEAVGTPALAGIVFTIFFIGLEKLQQIERSSIWPGIKAIVLAERGQSFRTLFENLRINVTSEIMRVVITPFAVVIPLAIQQHTGTGWIDLGLSN